MSVCISDFSLSKYKRAADTGARRNQRRGSEHFPQIEQGPNQVFFRSSVSSCQVSFSPLFTARRGLTSHSIWKPLRGPLRDWPLALCDASSVQPDQLAAADVVLKDKVSDNLQVHYDEGQKWYYLQDQESTELLIFRQADSHPSGRVGMSSLSHLFA